MAQNYYQKEIETMPVEEIKKLQSEKHAYVVLRVENNDTAEKALSDAGFRLITEADINKL